MALASAPIESLLARLGPGLTSDLASELQKDGLTPEAARQRLSRLARASKAVKTLFGLPFPKRTRFLYLQAHFGTSAYWQALVKAVKESGPAYAAALSGLQARGGVVPLAHFDIVSGAPVLQKRQLSSTTILERLKSASLVTIEQIPPLGECVCLARNGALGEVTAMSATSLRSRLIVEGVLLDAVRSWATKMNYSSLNAIQIRGETNTPAFSNFRFDLTGPCYLLPMRRQKDATNDHGFIVGDIVAGKTLTEEHVAAFLKKCRTLSMLKLRPFLPFLIADGFTREALNECRAAGVMVTTPKTLFGEDAAAALKDLFNTLEHAAAVAASDPGRLERLFSQLSKIEGMTNNVRGALFNMLIAHVLQGIWANTVDISVLVRDQYTGASAEIDVLAIKQKDVLCVECRGYQPSAQLSLADVKKWLENRVPLIHKMYRGESRFSQSNFRFELWTTGQFHSDAQAFLSDAKMKLVQYEIDWKHGEEVRAYTKQMSSSGALRMLDENFFKHPTAKIAKEAGGIAAPQTAAAYF